MTGKTVERRPDYDADGMTLWGRNLPFLRDQRFEAAYRRGIESGHRMGQSGKIGADIDVKFRASVCCWAARNGLRLVGDFVECGVNTGIFSLTVCHYLDFNESGKNFYLFDTYAGIPEEQISPAEQALRRARLNVYYFDCYELVCENFAPFPRARPIRGIVPDSLATVDIDRVAYLSIDMNITYPEVKALEYFWPRLSPGAVVVLDDYGFRGHEEQQQAMDAFAAEAGVAVLALPTGQGLLLKPPV